MKRVATLFAILTFVIAITASAVTPPKPATTATPAAHPAATTPAAHPATATPAAHHTTTTAATHPVARTTVKPNEAADVSRYFAAASTYYKERKLASSARELRLAAAQLERVAGNSDAPGKVELRQRAEDLERLAVRVEKGEVKSESEMDGVFGRSYVALASHHHRVAKRDLDRSMVAQTAKELEESGNYLEEAGTWRGRELDNDTRATVVKTRDLDDRIEKKEKVTKEEIGAELKEVGERIEQMGARIVKENPETSQR